MAERFWARRRPYGALCVLAVAVAFGGCSTGAAGPSEEPTASESAALTAPGNSTVPLQVQVQTASCGSNQMQDTFEVVNGGATPVALSDISIRFWAYDTSGQSIVPHVWTGGCVTDVNGNPTCVHQVQGVTATATAFSPSCGPDAQHQANTEITITSTDKSTLAPGAAWSNIQSALNLSSYGNFSPGTADWYSPCLSGSSYASDPHFAVYYQGNLVFSSTSGLTAPSCRSPKGSQALACSNYLVSTGAVAPVPLDTPLSLVVGLPLRNEAALDAFIAGASDPTRPTYGQYLSVAQFAAAYGASAGDYEALTQWAQSAGLSTTAYPNNLLLDVQGTAAQIEQAFLVNLVYGERADGSIFYQPDRCPSVNLAPAVDYVGGLTSFVQPSSLGVPGTGPGGALQSSDLRTAYLGAQTPCTQLQGDGQSIGLVEFEPFNDADIATFAQTTGIDLQTFPSPMLLNGVTGQPNGFGGECTFDIEMSLAMAPHAQVIPVEGTQIDSILGWLATNAIRQISDSTISADDGSPKLLKEMAAQGQTFLQASGDGGAYGTATAACTTGTGPAVTPGTGDVRMMPDLVLVGGTALTLASAASPTWQSETTWSGAAFGSEFLASGGGVMPVVSDSNFADPLPGFQLGLANLVSTKSRNSPDVAMPATNLFTVSSSCPASAEQCPVALVHGKCPVPPVCAPGQLVAGQEFPGIGTSGAAPLWAGFTALINQ